MPGIFTLIMFAALWLPGMLSAQEAETLILPEQPDVRIIVDISGSMKETDPNDLRQPAVRLLARVLPEGSTAGVWTFGQYVNMLVPHGEVTEPWRKTAVDGSRQINSVALRTNLGKAIEVASDDYVTGGSLENTHFILLTDGKVDISDNPEVNRAEEKRILSEVLQSLVGRGATFHPVALSDQADAGFLKTLAEQSGGSFRIADTADSLNLAFLDALNTAAPQEQIPIEGNAFTVDGGVKEFTALIFREKNSGSGEAAALELIRPDGETLSQSAQPDNVRWASEAAYDLVTITEPLAGEWRVKGELGEGSRVTVVSDLRMVVSPVPATFTAEAPVDVRVAFFEEAEKVTNPEFLNVLRVRLILTSEDGRSGSKLLSGDQPPADGEYTDTISKLPAEGLYRLDIVADGKTFARKFSATTEFRMPEGMVAPSVEPPIDINLAENAEPQQTASEPQTAVEPENLPETRPEEVSAKPLADEEPVVKEKPLAREKPSGDSEAPAGPEPEQAVEESAGLPFPLWMIGTGAGAIVILALFAFLLMRKRSKKEPENNSAGEESETLEELQQEMADIEAEMPVLMPEDPEPEQEPEPVLQAEPEQVQEEPEEEEIPVADSIVEPEETIPELTEPAEETDEEEFGLDDFDLSEFDDLPDFDLPDDEDPFDKREPDTRPDNERKSNQQERNT